MSLNGVVESALSKSDESDKGYLARQGVPDASDALYRI